MFRQCMDWHGYPHHWLLPSTYRLPPDVASAPPHGALHARWTRFNHSVNWRLLGLLSLYPKVSSWTDLDQVAPSRLDDVLRWFLAQAAAGSTLLPAPAEVRDWYLSDRRLRLSHPRWTAEAVSAACKTWSDAQHLRDTREAQQKALWAFPRLILHDPPHGTWRASYPRTHPWYTRTAAGREVLGIRGEADWHIVLLDPGFANFVHIWLTRDAHHGWHVTDLSGVEAHQMVSLQRVLSRLFGRPSWRWGAALERVGDAEKIISPLEWVRRYLVSGDLEDAGPVWHELLSGPSPAGDGGLAWPVDPRRYNLDLDWDTEQKWPTDEDGNPDWIRPYTAFGAPLFATVIMTQGLDWSWEIDARDRAWKWAREVDEAQWKAIRKARGLKKGEDQEVEEHLRDQVWDFMEGWPKSQRDSLHDLDHDEMDDTLRITLRIDLFRLLQESRTLDGAIDTVNDFLREMESIRAWYTGEASYNRQDEYAWAISKTLDWAYARYVEKDEAKAKRMVDAFAARHPVPSRPQGLL